MRRTELKGPPFTNEYTKEKRKRNADEEKEPDEIRSKIREMFPEGLPTGFGVTDYIPTKKKKTQPAGVNVEIKVNDSKELSAAFERAWREASYELRKLEAENDYQAFILAQHNTYA